MSVTFRKKEWFTTIMLVLPAFHTYAEQAHQPADTLEEVKITATRRPSSKNDVSATVDVISQEVLKKNIYIDEAEYFKEMPDIAYSRDLRRFGATRLNIRGLENNRIIQMVDGVRLPDVYDAGGGGSPTNFTFSGPLTVSQDFLKQIEVLRGSAASLYGSDALGGVASYVTFDADDVILPNKNTGVRYKATYTGETQGFTHSLLGAWRGEAVDVLLGVTTTDAQQLDNKGSRGGVSVSRGRPNPQKLQDQGLLAKLKLNASENHQLTFALEARAQNVSSEAKRSSAQLPKVSTSTGEDEAKRWRASIDWKHTPDNAFYDVLNVKLYKQDATTDNRNLQTRSNTSATCSAATGAGNDCLIDQQYRVAQDSIGLNAVFNTERTWWGAPHLLTYGIDLSRLKTAEIRDLTRVNLTLGTVSNTLAGDTFPLRDFPKGETKTLGIYLQDEISQLLGGKLTLIPGVRYDRRTLDADVDALFQTTLTANARSATDKTESRFSPKIGALWKMDDHWSLYGQLATGFRAPNYEEMNAAFRNTVQSYATSPNPDLKPETSLGIELGSRWQYQTVSGHVAVYDNHYQDFIANVRLNCPTDPRCINGVGITFINENVNRVRIYGAETGAGWQFAEHWRVDGMLAYAHGENETTQQPLNSVEPLKFSLALQHTFSDWGAEARVRGARAVSRVDDTGGVYYRPSGYAITHLAAWWVPFPQARVNLALNNLFDKAYIQWADIRYADALNPAGVDFYTQPGRNVSASFSYQF